MVSDESAWHFYISHSMKLTTNKKMFILLIFDAPCHWYGLATASQMYSNIRFLWMRSFSKYTIIVLFGFTSILISLQFQLSLTDWNVHWMFEVPILILVYARWTKSKCQSSVIDATNMRFCKFFCIFWSVTARFTAMAKWANQNIVASVHRS